MTSVDDLPDELLSQIFHCIPMGIRKKERRNLLLVSKRWKLIADSSIGLKIFIGTAPWIGWDAAAGLERININRIQNIGVSICHVGELIHMEELDNCTSESGGIFRFIWNMLDKVRLLFVSPNFPKFKYPHLLSTIRFGGIIRSDYFEKLITPATTYHLRQLKFNHSSLSLLESTTIANLDLDNLINLEVMADFTYLFRNVDETRILDNVLTLVRNKFPRLTTCNLYIPVSKLREIEINKIVFGFLNRHGSHLRRLEMCYFKMLDELFEDSEISNGSIRSEQEFNLKKKDKDLQELDQIVNEASEKLNLRVAILHLNFEELLSGSHWSRLLSKQSELECFLVVSPQQLHSKELIQQISRTLKVLTATVNLRDDYGQSNPVDCAAFSQCYKLTHLTLKGRFEDFVLLRTSAGLINAQSLPQYIQHVDLTRIPILSSELRTFLVTLPHLRHFAGKYLGRSGRMGVTLEILGEVIERRTVQWFLLEGCINGDFPEEGISNQHPFNPLSLVQVEGCFCAKLAGNGYYIMASPFEELVAKLLVRLF